MNAYLKRLERLAAISEGSAAVCDACKREGLTQSPYEHCVSAEHCNTSHQVMREHIKKFAERLRLSPSPPLTPEQEAEGDKLMEKIRAAVSEHSKQEREAWAIKRASPEAAARSPFL